MKNLSLQEIQAGILKMRNKLNQCSSDLPVQTKHKYVAKEVDNIPVRPYTTVTPTAAVVEVEVVREDNKQALPIKTVEVF